VNNCGCRQIRAARKRNIDTTAAKVVAERRPTDESAGERKAQKPSGFLRRARLGIAARNNRDASSIGDGVRLGSIVDEQIAGGLRAGVDGAGRSAMAITRRARAVNDPSGTDASTTL
jgi:hypothetical protein